MRTRRLASLAVLALVALSGFLSGWHLGQPDYVVGDYDGHVMRVEVMIYRNGELVYYDPDDPASVNFVALIAEIIAGDAVSGVGTATDGSTSIYKIRDSDRSGYVFVSFDDAYVYSPTMYALPQSYIAAALSSTGITLNASSKSVTLSAAVNINATGTIYGVGLYTDISIYYTSSLYGDYRFILFYDPLESPIQVNAGDVVTVVYRIVVP